MSANASKEIMVSYKIGDNEIKLTPKIVKDYIVGTGADITMQEFKFFAELCKVHKLNPFLREAYLIKYGNNPAQLIVGKDAILKRAGEHPQYDGKETGIIVKLADGTVEERPGCFVAPGETLLGGWAKVYRKDRAKPEYKSVSLDECIQRTKDGKPNSNWTKQPATMVEKVAKVRALREAFVDTLEGMLDSTEASAASSDDYIDAYYQEQPSEPVQDTQDDESISLNDL